MQDVYTKDEKKIDDDCLVGKVERFLQKYNQSLILQEIILIMLEFSEKTRQEPRKLLKTLRKLKRLKLTKQFNTESLEFTKKTIMEKIQICNDGFQMKNSQLVNLCYLYNANNSIDQPVIKETNLKGSLVNMLRKKNSQYQIKIEKIADNLSQEDIDFQEEVVSEQKHHEIEGQFENNINDNIKKQDAGDSNLLVRLSYININLSRYNSNRVL